MANQEESRVSNGRKVPPMLGNETAGPQGFSVVTAPLTEESSWVVGAAKPHRKRPLRPSRPASPAPGAAPALNLCAGTAAAVNVPPTAA